MARPRYSGRKQRSGWAGHFRFTRNNKGFGLEEAFTAAPSETVTGAWKTRAQHTPTHTHTQTHTHPVHTDIRSGYETPVPHAWRMSMLLGTYVRTRSKTMVHLE